MLFFLQGLNTLQNLKELNLADNNIEKIGRFFRFLCIFCAKFDLDSVSCSKKIIKSFFNFFSGYSLDPNVSLQNLNLSGNKINSFKVRLKTEYAFEISSVKSFPTYL